MRAIDYVSRETSRARSIVIQQNRTMRDCSGDADLILQARRKLALAIEELEGALAALARLAANDRAEQGLSGGAA